MIQSSEAARRVVVETDFKNAARAAVQIIPMPTLRALLVQVMDEESKTQPREYET